jgi:hypothetical protein
MSYPRQTHALARLIDDYAATPDATPRLSLAEFLIQHGVLVPSALTDAELDRAWLMGDDEGGQDYSARALRESLVGVAQRGFDTSPRVMNPDGADPAETRSRALAGEPCG